MISGSVSAGVTSPGRKSNEDEDDEEEEFGGFNVITRMRRFVIIFIKAHRSNMQTRIATNDLRGPLKIFIPRL